MKAPCGRMLVADYAEQDFEEGDYEPWIVCHADYKQLDDDVLLGLYQQWAKGKTYTDIADFADWLEDESGLGYTFLRMVQEGPVIIPCNEADTKEA